MEFTAITQSRFSFRESGWERGRDGAHSRLQTQDFSKFTSLIKKN
jgi:hypothetical protein